ncbi:MAG: 4-phytase [Firmicutes bacterium]|nr:4-phytase [Bacillota bacterium]
MRRAKRALITVLTLVSLLVAACSSGGSKAPSGLPGDAAGAPRAGGTLVVGSHAAHKSLAPYHWSSSADLLPINLIHEGLVTFVEGYKVVPRLALTWETSQDGLTWTFHLRQGVKWHDGVEFTADDVKFSLELYKNPTTKAKQMADFQAIKEVQVKDKYTAVVILSEPYAPFLRKVASQGMLPKHYHEKLTPEEYERKPIGTGPYKLQEWAPNQYVKLVANPDYWDGKPQFDAIENREIPEVATRMLALRSGEIQLDNWYPPPEEVAKFKADKNFQVTTEQTLGTMVLNLNNTNPILKDKRVRQAIAMGIDRQAIIRDLWKGLGVLANGPVPPAMEWYNPNVKSYPYDPEAAKKLLEEAGWKPGPDGVRVNGEGKRLAFTTLVIQGDEDRGQIAVTAQQWLKQVGIEMKIERNESGMLIDRVWKTRQFDAALYTWTLGGFSGDPDVAPQWSCNGTDNQALYCDPAMDKLIADGAREMDWEKRKAIYGRIQEKLAEDLPMIFLMQPLMPHVASAKIAGIKDGNFNTIEVLYKAWFKE